jgi:hypothetical protein
MTHYRNLTCKLLGKVVTLDVTLNDFLTEDEVIDLVGKSLKLGKDSRRAFLRKNGIVELEVYFLNDVED